MAGEAKFKQKFCKELKNLGCIVLQYQQGVSTVKGFPDTIVLLPEALTIFIEFKASKNSKFRPGQKEWHKKLNDKNFFSYICYPENADEILDSIRRIL